MPIHITLINLALAVCCFLCGLAVAVIAWTAYINQPTDGKPGCTKFSLRFWGSLISLSLFATGLYDLRQLAAQHVVAWKPAVLQASLVGLFALGALFLFRTVRRRNRIQTLLEHGQTEEAIELLEHWIQTARNPQDDLHSMLGMIYLNAGRPDQAVDHLRRAAEISQELPMHLCRLATALNDLGQLDEALALIQRAEQKDPGSRWVYVHNRCLFLARAGRVEEARALLPQVEQDHQRMSTKMPPLQQRQMTEVLSEMQRLCGQSPADSGSV